MTKAGATTLTKGPPFDARRFRNTLGVFPTGVTVITTKTADDTLVGITANSFSSVSLDPPLILFSLNRGARSLEIFQKIGVFAVNVLAHHQTALSNRFARSAADKWDGIDFTLSPLGCPVLNGALATFDCRLHAVHEGGDHVILVGHVSDFVEHTDGDPLVFQRGAYRHLSASFEPPATPEPTVAAPPAYFDPWGLGMID